ncbi:MAG: ribonuclease Y [Patescibacteria group bacterium]
MQQLLLGLLLGGGVSGVISFILVNKKIQQITLEGEQKTRKIIQDADDRARNITLEAQRRAEEDRSKIFEEKRESKERERRAQELEEKILQKEDRLEKKLGEIETRMETLHKKESDLEEGRRKQEKINDELREELAKVARLTETEAKDLLMKRTEERYEKDILGLIEKKRQDLKIRETELSKEILIKSIQQYAGDVTGETTQTLIHLESDDVKGKLIGKEGRNIIAFERATGVSLIIDDTPDTVFISSFDLFRRYIAKKSLEALIEDKRIQPARIEEIVEENQKEAEKLIYDLGQKTLNEMGIIGIPEEIIPLIGKFRFRTSYGQNILMHSKEVAYIAESIAKLIGADAALAFKGGLLHDLGKSMDHDIEGSHPEIGGKIARKYGLDEKLVNIIEGHHDGVPQICIETKIVQIADAISAVRPGARRMNAEEYVKRISEMENIAMSFSGVSKAYALSAGREVRVFVDAETISDLEAEKLAQEIAGNIEANLNYPGEVKVNLIRERRIIEYAR